MTNLAPGVYRYVVANQALELVAPGEFRPAVAKACNSQVWIGEAPVILVIYWRVSNAPRSKMASRPPLFTHIEAGLIAENIFLQVEALKLGAGIAGGMNDQALGQALKIPQANIPFLVMPVGYKP